MLSITKSSEHFMQNNHKNNQKGGEKKAEWLGIPRSKEYIVMSSQYFLFLSVLQLTNQVPSKHQQMQFLVFFLKPDVFQKTR